MDAAAVTLDASPLWLQLVVVVLGVARLTVLATSDRITRPLRWRVEQRFGRESYAGYLARCPWCTGWWIAFAATLAWLAWPVGTVLVLVPFAVAFAASALAAALAGDDPAPPDPSVLAAS